MDFPLELHCHIPADVDNIFVVAVVLEILRDREEHVVLLWKCMPARTEKSLQRVMKGSKCC